MYCATHRRVYDCLLCEAHSRQNIDGGQAFRYMKALKHASSDSELAERREMIMQYSEHFCAVPSGAGGNGKGKRRPRFDFLEFVRAHATTNLYAGAVADGVPGTVSTARTGPQYTEP